ncbi:MAG TPA: tetratricopeptide repeat protein, partial [Sandaracinaceae bacterium LLY-WYZ-13_1]|nr:tetratricopeptide repeat protein [Sandaracinaceae bacterium LLY-WYZ-13_1]
GGPGAIAARADGAGAAATPASPGTGAPAAPNVSGPAAAGGGVHSQTLPPFEERQAAAREPTEVVSTHRRKGGGIGRTLAKLTVAVAGLVLLAVAGLLAYRYSGLQVGALDQVLGLLGAAPERVAEADRIATGGEDDDEVGGAGADDAAGGTSTGGTSTDDGTGEDDDGTGETGEDDDGTGEDDDGVDAEDLVDRARRAGNSDLAERLYRRALEMDPQEHHAMVGLARLLMSRNRHAEAVPLLRRAVQRRSRRAAYRIWLGDALAGSGDRGAAQAAWREALEIDPDNRQAQRRLGQ